MALDADNVRVASTGGIYFAPTGATLPASTSDSLDADFGDELGYLSEDGIVETQDETTENIKAWQNHAVVRKVLTEHDLTYALAFLETNEDVLALVRDDYEAGVAKITGAAGKRGSWVFEIVDGDEHIRLVVPDGQITERGAVTYAGADAITYPVTVTAYPDADGVKAYSYYSAFEVGS